MRTAQFPMKFLPFDPERLKRIEKELRRAKKGRAFLRRAKRGRKTVA